MPELVAKGPIIPVRLMNELDSGRAVFFCGAGISMGPNSDLPSFGGLVDHVYGVNHLEPDAVEKEALDLDEPEPDRRRPSLDRALGLLERSDRIGASILRSNVIERLSKLPRGPLFTHEALIKLSRIGQGVRLITTNFDNRFVEAGLDEKLIDASPKLPVPKPHSWASTVYLHGRILPGDDGSNLVLTAADFGRAYLTERWAARFITELFREFTVVFVGYSLGDPVMSYMVDALAAERAKGARFATAYAFAEHDGGDASQKRVRDGWLAKNVQPILYNNKQLDHKLLSDTLVEWARIGADPYQARAQIALNEISKFPTASSDSVVERVTWALQVPVAATALADSAPITDEDDLPKLEAWLDMFARAGLLSRSAQGIGGDRTGHENSPVQLVDGGFHARNPPLPDNVTFQLGRWMARHLHAPQVLAWVLKRGGQLHPSLRHEVRRNLAGPVVEIPAKLRHLWTILAVSDPVDPSAFLWTDNQLKTAASASERRRIEEQVIKSIAPCLIVHPGPSSYLRLSQYFDKKNKPISPIDTCGHLELSVGDTDHRHLVQDILDNSDVLSRNAEVLTGYLDHALTLLADDGDVHADSYLYRPSISAHDQNRHHDDWVYLIDLVRDSYFALVYSDGARSKRLLTHWVFSKQYLFRRLALHALTEDRKSDIRLAKKLLITGRRPGLWELELRREVLRFFRLAGARLPRDLRIEIVRAIHAGPKSKAGKALREDSELLRREKALRLYKLVQAGATLDKKSKALADEGKPPAEDIPEERDEFLSWMGQARWVGPEDFTPQNLLTRSIPDVVAALGDGQIDPRGFEGLALQQPVKAASAIRCLAKRQEWPKEVWQRFLWSIAGLRRQQKLKSRLEEYVARLLSDAPDELFSGVGSAAADFVMDLAEVYGVERETSLRTLWHKAWKGVRCDPQVYSDDPVGDALNHTAGKLSEAALTRLWKYEPKANDGLPESVRPYFDAVVTDPNGYLGRVMLAARLHQLFTIAPDWTGEHLIPLLSPPGSDEARGLWSGYAWTPTVGPNLLAAFKEPFLMVLASHETLGRQGHNLIHLFVAICLEAPNELTTEEIQSVMDSLGEKALSAVLRALAHRLNGTPEERARAWNDKIKPWLQEYWPSAGARNTTATSEAMLKLIVECGDAFPDAVCWSLHYLRPIRGFSLFRLEKNEHVENHPDSTVRTLKILVGDGGLLDNKYTLRKILDALGHNVPAMKADPDFRNLYEIAIQ